MAPSIWIHCNKCYTHLIAQNQQFFFTNCGHILCYKCTQHSNAQKQCIVCGAKISFLPINKELPIEVAAYFQPTHKIHKFQYENMEKLIKHYMTKYDNAKKEFIRLRQAYQQQKDEINRLKNYIESMQRPKPTIPHNYSNEVHMPFNDSSMNMSNVPMNVALPMMQNQSKLSSHFHPNFSRGSDRSVGRASSVLSLSQIFNSRNRL